MTTTYGKFFESLQARTMLNVPVAHRGYIDLEETIPENSLAAVHNCLNRGIQFIEIDIQMTKDGHLICMHDESVDRMTNGNGEISELTLNEIKELNLYEGDGSTKILTNEKVPTLTEMLTLSKNRALLNIDKGWDYKEQFYAVLEELDCFENAIIKSEAAIEETELFLRHASPRFLYMHKIFESDIERLDDILAKTKPLICEISFYDENEQIVSPAFIEELKKKSNVWLNALNVSNNAGINDQLSLEDPDKGWGWLINRKPNFIQTDYSAKYTVFLETKK